MSQIVKATPADFETVATITRSTITAVYPHYYPQGAVDFFLHHHSDEAIQRDLEAGCVYLLLAEEKPVGTVTLNGKELNRLFVLPEHQGKGYGKQLLDFAENTLLAAFGEVTLSASLPAKAIYRKRGYREIGFYCIETENGDVLCYDEMVKRKGEIL